MVKRTFSLSMKSVRSGYVDPGSVRDLEIADDAAIGYAKLALTGGIVDADVNAAAAIAGSKISPDVSNALVGTASGEVIIHGQAEITGSGTVTTGLTTVTTFVACQKGDYTLQYNGVTVEASGANFLIKVWKPTGAADCTPIAATTLALVKWIAIGTL